MAYRVEKSPVRIFLFGLVGVVLLLASVDIVWGHWLSTVPEVSEEGVITTRGRSQRRADFVWGAALFVGGVGMFGYAVTSLIRRRPVMVLDEEGIDLFVTGPTADPTFVSWGTIRSVLSAADQDPDGGPAVDVLIFDLNDRGPISDRPWGARWDGNRLKVDATGWDVAVGEVAARAELDLDRYRRNHLDAGGEGDD
jgi:hypothetical protein